MPRSEEWVRRLRVAIFTDTFVPQVNGVAHTLRRLVDYLKTRAVPHIVFAPEDGPAPRVPHVFLQPSFRFFLYPECRLAWPNYPAILHLLDDFRPTLVHLVTPFSLGLAGLRYASQFSLPSLRHRNLWQCGAGGHGLRPAGGHGALRFPVRGLGDLRPSNRRLPGGASTLRLGLGVKGQGSA